MKDVIQAMEQGLADPEPIPDSVVRSWMSSTEPRILGATYAFLTNPVHVKRVSPPLPFDEVFDFVLHYYEWCLKGNPQCEWADSRWSAGTGLVSFTVGLVDQGVEKTYFDRIKKLLEDLYKILSANGLAFDPLNSNTVYAAIGFLNFGYGQYGLHGGVLKSTDAGAPWTLATSGLPPDISVRFLAIDPQNPGTVYAATGNDLAFVPDVGSGVFKSVNGGASWYSASTGLSSRDYHSGVVALVIDPMSPATVYVAETAGIFKSTDGAMTWQPASSGLPPTGISALAMDPRNSATLYAGTLDGVFTTTDGGQSWVALNYPGLQWNPPNGSWPGVLQLLFDPQNPSKLYAVAGGAVLEINFSGVAATGVAHLWVKNGVTFH